MIQTDSVLSRLSNVRRQKDGWLARCPAHDDRNPSLSITPSGERLLLYCHAGCELRAITEAIGLPLAVYGVPDREDFQRRTRPMQPRIVANYPYTNAKGEVLYEAVRYEPKDFRVRRPDGKGGFLWNLDDVWRVPYNLAEILKQEKQPVLVVEGEKDVETLRSLGLVGTCNIGGAGKWHIELGAHLQGRRVAVLPDNDDAGWRHGLLVAASLLNYASSIRVVYLPGLPDGGDVTDFVEASKKIGTDPRSDLLAAIKAAPEWRRFEVQQAA